jgi:predicted ATP-dependent Lon-type protease
MKQLKLITAVVAAFVCLNFVFAGKPLKGTTENLATILVDKLGKDVQLTDSQKVAIKEYTKKFITNMESADSIPTNEAKFKSKEQISQNYEAVIDSLLTTDQKTQRKIKIKDREKGNTK